jgi:uncharacterized protein
MVEVTVASVEVDEQSKNPIVILREKDGDRVLKIWIGLNEAQAIEMELRGLKYPRPLTHDLIRQVVVGLGAHLHQVRITAVKDNTYYAELELRREQHVVQVDARPSDSIAIALRLDAPIFASEVLFSGDGDSWSGPEPSPDAPPEILDPERLKKHIERLDPQDFGKFTPP